jgi:hypothetical protein
VKIAVVGSGISSLAAAWSLRLRRHHTLPSPQPSLDLAPSPLDAFVRTSDFSERHHRMVLAPAGAVWAAATSVTPAEIRLLTPFMRVRSLPQVLTGRREKSLTVDDASFLDVFEAEGFVALHRDASVANGRAVAIYGAVGRFWSPTRNSPLPLEDAQAFARHEAAGTVKVAFSLEVVESGTSTLVTTETRIVGTDRAARRAFGRYWLIIRGPSGLIRRSWLAAIDRRARA